jgi:DNA-binding NarL/FixJ family response regulator
VLADAPHSTQGSKPPLRRGGCAGALQKAREIDDEGSETSETRSATDPADDSAPGAALAVSLLMPGRDEEVSNGHSLAAAAFDADAPKRPCTNGAQFANGANSAHRYAWKAMVPNAVQRHSFVRTIRDGDEFNSADASSAIRGPKISDRELQILDGLVKGHGNKMIARECAITEATVKVHMKSILRKICVANRTQAAIWALEHGYCSHLPDARNIGRGTNGIAARAVMREQDL